MKHTVTVKCTYPGCSKTGFYEYASRREQFDCRHHREKWTCARHIDPDAVMSPTSLEREASLVSEIGEGTGGYKYWNNCGVIHGLGFKAYADDFPAGTKITVTAKIELPTDKTAVKPINLPQSELSEYPRGTAFIRYRDGSGKVCDWFVGADPKRDNEETLRAHLRLHMPSVEFIGWAVK